MRADDLVVSMVWGFAFYGSSQPAKMYAIEHWGHEEKSIDHRKSHHRATNSSPNEKAKKFPTQPWPDKLGSSSKFKEFGPLWHGDNSFADTHIMQFPKI